MTFYPLEKLHRLSDGYCKSFTVAGRDLLLVERGGNSYLLDNRCPHAGHPLHHATFSKGKIRCPLHGMEFYLHTGKPVHAHGETSIQNLTFYKLTYRDNQIGVDLSD